ncbi:MAG: serine hydrolase domain-containing protein [Ferruginibacter sp.]
MAVKKITLLFTCLTAMCFIVHAQFITKLDKSKISFTALDNKIQALMKAANVCGIAVSVFNNNKPVYSKIFGLANVQKNEQLLQTSIMYGASFAKMVFAYTAMQYVQEKVLDLDKPLIEYLNKPLIDYKINGWNRGYQDLKNDERYKKITARMCLTHTTGFPNWRWFEADKKLKIKFEPGSRYSYSGEGLYLLQFVIEQITGKDYETISQERIFKPLGMLNTSQVWQSRFDDHICYGHNAKGEPYDLMKWKEASAGGSMSTTLEDITKFYTALISSQGLTKTSFNEMTRTQVRIRSRSQFGPLSKVDSTDNDNIELGYGLGVGVFKTKYGNAFFKEGHDDGWGHYSVCFPDKKTAIIIMTNNDNGESIFKELLAFTIGDTFTPWRWENYIPYDQKEN